MNYPPPLGPLRENQLLDYTRRQPMPPGYGVFDPRTANYQRRQYGPLMENGMPAMMGIGQQKTVPTPQQLAMQKTVPTPQQLAMLEQKDGPAISDSPFNQPGGQRPGQAFNQEMGKLRALAPDPRKRSLASHIGSVALPALFGGLAGGSARDAMLYGVGSAAFNYNNELEGYKGIEEQIANAAMKLPQAEADYDQTIADTNYRNAGALNLLAGDPSGTQRTNSTEWNDYLQVIDQNEKPSREGFLKYLKDRKLAGYIPENKVVGSPFGNMLVDGSGKVIIQGYGGLSPEGIAADAFRTGVKETEEQNAAIYPVLNSSASNMRQMLVSLRRIQKKIQDGPETYPGGVSDFLSLVSPEMQVLAAATAEPRFIEFTSLKNQGLTFGSTTEREWKSVADLGPQLGNYKDANLRIVGDKISTIERDLQVMESKLRDFPQVGSGTRPGQQAPSYPAGAAQAAPVPPVQPVSPSGLPADWQIQQNAPGPKGAQDFLNKYLQPGQGAQ